MLSLWISKGNWKIVPLCNQTKPHLMRLILREGELIVEVSTFATQLLDIFVLLLAVIHSFNTCLSRPYHVPDMM